MTYTHRFTVFSPLFVQDKPVTERYTAMRHRVHKLDVQREKGALSDDEVSNIVKSIKAKLKPEDMAKINDMVEKRTKKHLRWVGVRLSLHVCRLCINGVV